MAQKRIYRRDGVKPRRYGIGCLVYTDKKSGKQTAFAGVDALLSYFDAKTLNLSRPQIYAILQAYGSFECANFRIERMKLDKSAVTILQAKKTI